MDYMKKRNETGLDLDKYLQQYVGTKGVEFDRAVTALSLLVDDDVITEEIAGRVLKIMLARHLQNEITSEIQANTWLNDNKQKLKFIGLKYDRREEIFA